MKARFPAFLEQHGIKHIPAKIKHPQSNGKAEKFIHLYKVRRHKFKTKEKFIHWYNEVRPHMSLDEKTPEEAYQERKKEGRKYYIMKNRNSTALYNINQITQLKP